MSISGISGYGQTSQVYGIEELEQYWEERRQSNQSTVSQYSSDQASFSQTGLLMSQLLQLSQTDQSQFKTVAQQISDDLTTQAQSATTIQNQQALTDLSAKFATAAQSGSMDSLRPEGPPPGGAPQGDGGGVLGEISSTIADDLSGLSNASTTSSSTASLSGQEDPFGQLMQQLAALQTSDPEKFKQVTQQISSDLAEQAESSSDGFESQMLADMSSKFAEAAESGSMDSLKPQGPPPPPPQSSGQDDSSDSTSTAETGQSSKDLFSLLNSILSKDLAGVSNAGGAGNLFSLLSGQSTSGSSV